MRRGPIPIAADVNLIEFGGLAALLLAFLLTLLAGQSLQYDYAPLQSGRSPAAAPSARLFISASAVSSGETLEVYFIGGEAGQSVTLEITYPSGETLLTQMPPTGESGIATLTLSVSSDSVGSASLRALVGGQAVAATGFHVWE